ncbi:MAG: FAD-dependent oxidoreductase [Acidimicrobiia bacterium]
MSDASPITPRRLDDVAAWDAEADVVVVGFGCAGACAAIEAADAGADVLIVERMGGAGGVSAMAGGLIYLGGGTPIQQACGFDDTPEAMFKTLMAACGPDADEEKVSAYCEGSVEHFLWLRDRAGVPFTAAFSDEPNIEAPTDAALCFSGGEDAYPLDRIAPPAPRAHKPAAPNAAGWLLMQSLANTATGAGIRTEFDSRVDRLVVDDHDGVVGLVAHRFGKEFTVRAKRAVVLAAGGFTLNDAMLEQHAPALRHVTYKIGTDADDGRGIRMAQAVGADVRRMDAAEVAVPIAPPRPLVRGILVNEHGQRFVNEDAYPGRIGQEALFHQNAHMYLVLDEELYEVNLLGMQATWVCETVAELEAEMGLPEGSLQATVELYNRHAERGEDPVFHKHARWLKPLTSPPYGAVDWRMSNSLYAAFTLGGLRTRVTGEVVGVDGRDVPGLFAAGRTTSGVPAWGYVSGISLGDGTFFGRLAGRKAAQTEGQAQG